MPAKGSRWVREEWDETSRCSNDGDASIRKGWGQQRLGRSRPGIRPKGVILEEGNRDRFAQAQNAQALKQQVFYVAPSVLPSRLSFWSRIKIW